MREARDYAARSGNLELLEFIYSKYTERYTTSEGVALVLRQWAAQDKEYWPMMVEVSRNGLLEMVKFLHNHHGHQCTSSAMDYAAENGHLDVVQWLHENRSQDCTAYAMNRAASNGHLE